MLFIGIGMEIMKRKPDESFKDYKKRQKEENKRIKEKLRGVIFWSSGRGTYKRGIKT